MNKLIYFLTCVSLLAAQVVRAQQPATTGTNLTANRYRGFSLEADESVILTDGFSVSAEGFAARISPGQIGEWGPVFTWGNMNSNVGIVGIHTTVLPNGKVLSWAGHNDNLHDHTGAALWNPLVAKSFEYIDNEKNIFCSSHTLLASGRLLVAGGYFSNGDVNDDFPKDVFGEYPDYPLIVSGTNNPSYARGFIGLRDASLYDYMRPTVSTAPAYSQWDVINPPMTDRRWYPTAVTLSNGEALVIAGQIDGGKAATATTPASGERQSVVPEVWTGSAWRRLTGATQGLPWYPWMFAAPNGKVFYAGNTPTNTTRYLDPSGTGSWSAPFTAEPQAASNRGAYSDQRYWGSAVLYERGQLLLLGGNGAAGTTSTTQLTDLTGPAGTPQFRPGSPMRYPRFHHNATVLPTGQVLVSGGTTNATNDADEYGVLPAELWTPPTGTTGGGTWQTVAALTEPRLYHSTAVLLPNG